MSQSRVVGGIHQESRDGIGVNDRGSHVVLIRGVQQRSILVVGSSQNGQQVFIDNNCSRGKRSSKLCPVVLGNENGWNGNRGIRATHLNRRRAGHIICNDHGERS